MLQCLLNRYVREELPKNWCLNFLLLLSVYSGLSMVMFSRHKSELIHLEILFFIAKPFPMVHPNEYDPRDECGCSCKVKNIPLSARTSPQRPMDSYGMHHFLPLLNLVMNSIFSCSRMFCGAHLFQPNLEAQFSSVA